VLLPVKAFHEAKLRLAPALDDRARARLARAMAATVVAAASPLPVWVVCDDAEVATWADGLGVSVLERPGRGLDGAVTDGVAMVAAEGIEQVIVSHADLPHARELAFVGEFDGITLVPDRRDDVIALPATCGFRFAYGPGSFGRHRTEAGRVAQPYRVLRDERLAWDVDVPADLTPPAHLGAS
jgi:2-phospho-L-lactate guanylyltransferase